MLACVSGGGTAGGPSFEGVRRGGASSNGTTRCGERLYTFGVCPHLITQPFPTTTHHFAVCAEGGEVGGASFDRGGLGGVTVRALISSDHFSLNNESTGLCDRGGVRALCRVPTTRKTRKDQQAKRRAAAAAMEARRRRQRETSDTDF